MGVNWLYVIPEKLVKKMKKNCFLIYVVEIAVNLCYILSEETRDKRDPSLSGLSCCWDS